MGRVLAQCYGVVCYCVFFATCPGFVDQAADVNWNQAACAETVRVRAISRAFGRVRGMVRSTFRSDYLTLGKYSTPAWRKSNP